MQIVYDSRQLEFLLRQWASGNLDNIVDEGHCVVGVSNAVVTHSGMTAMRLAERFTVDEVSAVLLRMLQSAEAAKSAIAIICIHLYGWTIERLGRVLNMESVSQAMTHLIRSQDIFAQWLLNG